MERMREITRDAWECEMEPECESLTPNAWDLIGLTSIEQRESCSKIWRDSAYRKSYQKIIIRWHTKRCRHVVDSNV